MGNKESDVDAVNLEWGMFSIEKSKGKLTKNSKRITGKRKLQDLFSRVSGKVIDTPKRQTM